jgi:hypothetical protein
MGNIENCTHHPSSFVVIGMIGKLSKNATSKKVFHLGIWKNKGHQTLRDGALDFLSL